MNKKEFLNQLRTVIREETRNVEKTQPTWMRSAQVRDMLNISDSTLQTLRIKGTIPAYKLDTTWFYKEDEIIGVLEANRTIKKEVKDDQL